MAKVNLSCKDKCCYLPQTSSLEKWLTLVEQLEQQGAEIISSIHLQSKSTVYKLLQSLKHLYSYYCQYI
jgi:predicted transcriptional regulator